MNAMKTAQVRRHEHGRSIWKACVDYRASRGIGAAIALRLAREGAGVAITYERSAGKAQGAWLT
jgi:hypothetical protein